VPDGILVKMFNKLAACKTATGNYYFFSVHCVKHKNYSVYKVETANLKQISVSTLFIFNTPALNNVLL